MAGCTPHEPKPAAVPVTAKEYDSNQITIDTLAIKTLKPTLLFHIASRDFWTDSAMFQKFFVGRFDPRDTLIVAPNNLTVKDGRFYIPNLVQKEINVYDSTGVNVEIIDSLYKFGANNFSILSNGNYILSNHFEKFAQGRGVEINPITKSVVRKLFTRGDMEVQVLNNGYCWAFGDSVYVFKESLHKFQCKDLQTASSGFGFLYVSDHLYLIKRLGKHGHYHLLVYDSLGNLKKNTFLEVDNIFKNSLGVKILGEDGAFIYALFGGNADRRLLCKIVMETGKIVEYIWLANITPICMAENSLDRMLTRPDGISYTWSQKDHRIYCLEFDWDGQLRVYYFQL